MFTVQAQYPSSISSYKNTKTNTLCRSTRRRVCYLLLLLLLTTASDDRSVGKTYSRKECESRPSSSYLSVQSAVNNNSCMFSSISQKKTYCIEVSYYIPVYCCIARARPQSSTQQAASSTISEPRAYSTTTAVVSKATTTVLY